MAKNAVVGRLASICVEQSSRDPNKEERLKELKAFDPWKRGEYAQKQGWARMPGEKEADSAVADECVRGLIKD